MFAQVTGAVLNVVGGPGLDINHWDKQRPGSGPQVLRSGSDPPFHLPVSKAKPAFSLLSNGECVRHSSSLGNVLFSQTLRETLAIGRKDCDLDSRQEGSFPSPSPQSPKEIPPPSANKQSVCLQSH